MRLMGGDGSAMLDYDEDDYDDEGDEDEEQEDLAGDEAAHLCIYILKTRLFNGRS